MDVFLEQIWSTACGAAKCCHGLLQTLVPVGRSWRRLGGVGVGPWLPSSQLGDRLGSGQGVIRRGSGWRALRVEWRGIGYVLALWSLLRARVREARQGRLGQLLPGDALLRVDDFVLRIGAEDGSAVLRERSC